MEQPSHYDAKTDLYLVWVHLFQEAKKALSSYSTSALDYHLEKSLCKPCKEFLENTMEVK